MRRCGTLYIRNKKGLVSVMGAVKKAAKGVALGAATVGILGVTGTAYAAGSSAKKINNYCNGLQDALFHGFVTFFSGGRGLEHEHAMLMHRNVDGCHTVMDTADGGDFSLG